MARTRRDTGELTRDGLRKRRVNGASDHSVTLQLVTIRVEQWMVRKGKGLGETKPMDQGPRFKHKEQDPVECRSLLAAQLRAIVMGARRDGLVYRRFDVGEDD
jgi:hypothetical protein